MEEHGLGRRRRVRPDVLVGFLQKGCGRHQAAPSFGGAVVDSARPWPVREVGLYLMAERMDSRNGGSRFAKARG
jgi:hypothetical protein